MPGCLRHLRHSLFLVIAGSVFWNTELGRIPRRVFFFANALFVAKVTISIAPIYRPLRHSIATLFLHSTFLTLWDFSVFYSAPTTTRVWKRPFSRAHFWWMSAPRRSFPQAAWKEQWTFHWIRSAHNCLNLKTNRKSWFFAEAATEADRPKAFWSKTASGTSSTAARGRMSGRHYKGRNAQPGCVRCLSSAPRLTLIANKQYWLDWL